MAPKDIQILTLEPTNINLCGKSTFLKVIKLGSWDEKSILDCPGP